MSVAAEASARPIAGGSGRIRAIDGYRGIGALMVLLAHAALAGIALFHGVAYKLVYGLDVALPLFFVLSGTMTYLPLMRAAIRGKVPESGAMISARLWRLLPVYFVVIIVVWSLRFAGTTQDWLDLLRHLTFTQVWSKHQIFWTDGPSWFLADDMYLFMAVALFGPPLARVAARRETMRARIGVMLALPLALFAIGEVYTTVVSYVLHVNGASYYTYYNPLAKANQFAEGMVLGILLAIPGVARPRPKLASLLSLIGAGVIGSMWFIRSDSELLSVYYFTITGLACAFLLGGAAMLKDRQLLSRLLCARPLQFVSTVGFAVFLVQEPVMIVLEQWHILYFQSGLAWVLSTVAWMVSASLVAWVTYQLIERPGFRVRRLLADLGARQRAGKRRRSGPAPRRLPDLILQLPAGGPVALREMVGSKPLLLALNREGETRLAEQRFRLDAGEADGLLVMNERDSVSGSSAAGVLLDPARKLSKALNVPAVLLEVAPDGLITALHEPEGVLA